MSEHVGNLLVVDDNRMNRITLQRSLEQQGHTVVLAEDGQQALDKLADRHFDVVLLDILMPVLDGFQVLQAMKANPEMRNIPVIVISALDETDSAVRAIEMGAEDYLTKPINTVFLKARLESSLRRKRLRDLEQAYLRQDAVLRQSEKLATLGRLSAGMAHELNNPAAAIQRGTKQMQDSFQQHLEAEIAIDPEAEHSDDLSQLLEFVRAREDHRTDLDPIERGDRESELSDWMDARNVENGWELAPELVTMGYDVAALESLAGRIAPERLNAALKWVISGGAILNGLDEIAEAAQRIAAIVKSLKTYTYMDRAPVQNVDIREGLESTLVMLRSRLRNVTVHRDFATDLPRIEAYSGELNQVWTNLIDNAVAAMKGEGELTLRTRRDGDRVVVEITDNGPGIPEAIQPMIFDPFFTTKPPGEGTGLGLNITHTIIVQKHKGEIAVSSHPGQTTFQIRLPLTLERADDGTQEAAGGAASPEEQSQG